MARAGGVTLGYLRYILGLDTLSFKKGMTDAERDLLVMQKRFESVGSKMASLGNKLTVGLTLPLAAFAAKGISEARETAAAMAQVNASLASMGPVAGRTAVQLEKAATAFESKSLYEADQVLKDVTATMLTFGNITGQTFDRAQQAALDLATKFGKDLASSSVLVGKALNDPIKGLSALSRVGVQFTAAQQKQIKAMVEVGNTAGAQALILGELERQVKGSAAAAQNADPWNKAQDAFKQLAETVGTALIPVIDQLVPIIVSIGNAFASLSPETQKWLIIAGGAVAILGPVLSILGNVILVVSNMGPLVLALSKAWAALNGVMALARVMAIGLLPTLTPFLIPLGAIALAVGAVYLAWKNWDKIKAIVASVYNAVKTYISDKLTAVFDGVKKRINDVGDWFQRLYDRVVGHSYIPDMVDEIAAQMAKLDAVMVAPVQAATGKAAEAFRTLQEQTKGLLDRLFPESASLNALKSDIATLEDAMRRGILTADQYAEALRRLKMEGLSEEPIGVVDTGTLVPSDEDVVGNIDVILEKMGQVVDRSQQWREVIGNVATDLAQMAGDWLSAFIEGTAKLKDLWRGILGYAIRALTSSNGPLQALFGGARASGGPVMSGKAYLVGERGPELFMPGSAGRILSNDNTRSAFGSGTTQIFNFPNSDADSFRRNEAQVARAARRAARI